MIIHGFIKTTLLDYPGHLASTLFTGGCNFRCPFCQNAPLLLSPSTEPRLPVNEILSYLKKRRNILDGVCITGGEPTLCSDLKDFILLIKEMGLKVKLDTNGYKPTILQDLCDHGYVDYVAMDIKSTKEGYKEACGIANLDYSNIQRSIDYLRNGTIPYEFRTTVVRQLHTKEDLIDIAHQLKGCRAYYLQAFKYSETNLNREMSGYSDEELINIYQAVSKILPKTKLRGIDFSV